VTVDALRVQLALLPEYLSHHLVLTVVALTVGIAVCLPLGAWITRVRPLQWFVLTAAGVLQTIPGLALLALMVPLLGTIGFVPAVTALILYSFLPILRNTVTGILGVDPAVREAARGIGMTDWQLLVRVEWPLALPVIVAGIRTAAVWVVGTATLATPVGATSLGNYIFSGLQTQNITAVLVGCVAAALLAIVLDQLIHRLERAVAGRSRRRAVAAVTLLLIVMIGGAVPALRSARGDGNVTIAVGSKPFTEQYILAEALAFTLETAGFGVERRPGMGSMILFEALTRSDIDVYVDYSGTLWTNVMRKDHLPPRDSLLRGLTAWLKQNHGVICLGALGFENTYVLAVPRALADRHGLRTLHDLARIAPDLRMGSDYEFYSRPEWDALTAQYGLAFGELRTFDPSLMYEAVRAGDVDVISAYSTDGRIIDYDLVALSDPVGALPPYDAVLLLSPAASNDRVRAALVPWIGRVDADRMREANRRVDQEGEQPARAAALLLQVFDSGDVTRQMDR